MSKADLRLDWCSYEAAKYAVEHWHYSRTMPVSKRVQIGVWESGVFIGAVVFSWGATPNLCKPFGIKMTECVELVRVALTNHITPVSRIVSIACKMIKKQSPGLRLIVSFADVNYGHHGGIYQAGGWIYSGKTLPSVFFRANGMVKHPRSFGIQFGKVFGIQSIAWVREHIDPNAEEIIMLGKYRYLYPLDAAMRAQIEPLRKPYPKREPRGSGEIDSAAQSNVQTGGASPTDPLLIDYA